MRPIATLGISGVFGVYAAALATLGFGGARQIAESVFRGMSLIPAVIAAGFGCWAYVWIARPRFAAHFAGGDDFSALLRFYVRAAVTLGLVYAAAQGARAAGAGIVSVLFFCMCGGAAAAAAFQTVLAFVPDYKTNKGA
ncbi:MAG: hypothetical protein K2Q06_15780 [Parvularculaceae bacterium]|nr:hypothetical protein [Parvularculaceae bacterium]